MGRVALVGDNTVEYISLLIDIWNNGDCAVLLDWRMPFHAILKTNSLPNLVTTCRMMLNFFLSKVPSIHLVHCRMMFTVNLKVTN